MLRVKGLERHRSGCQGRTGRERKRVCLVVQFEVVVRSPDDLQCAGGEQLGSGRAEHGKQHATLQRGRIPIDVKERRVRAATPTAEDVPPPNVRALGDAHVVWHDVEELPHLRGPECVIEATKPGFSAERPAHPRRIDDVIPVSTVLRRLHVR